MAQLTRHFVVSGTVQGVGFRAFVQRVGRDLRLKGWVRNLADGTVEALAIGPVERLDRFSGELRIGPPRAQVRTVLVEDVATGAKIEGFQIR